MAKKKVKKKKLEEVVDNTYLSHAQLDRIKYNELDIRSKNLELDKARLMQQIVTLKYEVESMKVNESIKLLQTSFNGKIEANSNYMKCLAEAHGIEGKWSFQPESGEILKEE